MQHRTQQNEREFFDFLPSEEGKLINAIDDLKEAIRLFTTVMISAQLKTGTMQ